MPMHHARRTWVDTQTGSARMRRFDANMEIKKGYL